MGDGVTFAVPPPGLAVYVLCEDDPRTARTSKIGRASNVEKRQKTFQTGNSRTLVPAYAFYFERRDDTVRLETAVKRYLRARNYLVAAQEQFSVTPAELAAVVQAEMRRMDLVSVQDWTWSEACLPADVPAGRIGRASARDVISAATPRSSSSDDPGSRSSFSSAAIDLKRAFS